MIRIRPATPRDAEGVARTHVASWKGAYRGIFDNAYLDGLDWSQRYDFWSMELAQPPIDRRGTWVAIEENTVLGFASVGPARDADRQFAGSWELYGIYLLPDRWGEGLGRDLLQESLNSLSGDITEVSLWVLGANVRARRFYERQGFVADGSEKLEQLGGRTVNEMRYRRRANGVRGLPSSPGRAV